MSLQSVARLSPATVTPVTTAETAVLVTPAFTYDQPTGAGVIIDGTLYVSVVGAAATAATVRIRQGNGIAGPVVGVAMVEPVVAASTKTIPFTQLDASRFPAQSGGAQYTVTIQFTAATGNSTVAEATISASGA